MSLRLIAGLIGLVGVVVVAGIGGRLSRWVAELLGVPRQMVALGGWVFAPPLAATWAWLGDPVGGTVLAELLVLGWAVVAGGELAVGPPENRPPERHRRIGDLWWLGAGALTGLGLAGVGAALGALIEAAFLWSGRPAPVQSVVVAVLEAQGPGWWSWAVFVVVVAPLLEELLFRGQLFSAVLSMRSAGGAGVRGAATVVSALAFGAFHAADPWAVPVLTVVGLGLGALRARTGSVWPGVVAHGVYNTVGLVGLG